MYIVSNVLFFLNAHNLGSCWFPNKPDSKNHLAQIWPGYIASSGPDLANGLGAVSFGTMAQYWLRTGLILDQIWQGTGPDPEKI